MKTLEQIANEIGVSKSAIYKKLLSYGISVNQLKCEKVNKTKVFGDVVERIIQLMFLQNGNLQTSEKETEKKDDENTLKIQELQAIIDRLEVENKEKETEKKRLEDSNLLLLNQIDKLTDAIRAAEAIQAAQATQIQMISARKQQGIIQRIKARLKGE